MLGRPATPRGGGCNPVWWGTLYLLWHALLTYYGRRQAGHSQLEEWEARAREREVTLTGQL